MPGGNGAIAEAALKKMTETVPLSHFRPRALVFDVQVTKQGVLVSYINHLGKTAQIQAEVAVLGCPKFVVKRVLRDIEPERLKAIEQLNYNAYLQDNWMYAAIETSIQEGLIWSKEAKAKLG
jgi:hypothetical protein